MDYNIIAALVIWSVLMLLAFWHVQNRKAPHRSTLQCYAVFLGVLGGAGLILLSIFVLIDTAFDPDRESMITKTFISIITVGVLLPAWHIAHKLITR